MKYDRYVPLYGWLIIAGLILFGVFLLWQSGYTSLLYENDKTRLSIIILILFASSSVYLGWCSLKISRQNIGGREQISEHSWAGQYLQQLEINRQNQSNMVDVDAPHSRLVANAHGLHHHGWFFADLLIRLGLIGTVIGFVLMLGSVNQLQADEIHALKQLLSSMGTGMQVALYTTLTGLGSAILLSLQCHWLDHCADRLINQIIDLGMVKARRAN